MLGLLQPIVIDQHKELIIGYRRYVCCKELGKTIITARVINTKNKLHKTILEIRENIDRHDFTFSEKMKAAEKIEPMIQAESLKRKKTKEKSDYHDFGIGARKGTTRDIVAEIAGFGSGPNYQKAKKIWESKDKDIIDKLDSGKIKINRAYNLVLPKKETEQLPLQVPESKKPLNKKATIDILDLLINQINDCTIEPHDTEELMVKINMLKRLIKKQGQ